MMRRAGYCAEAALAFELNSMTDWENPSSSYNMARLLFAEGCSDISMELADEQWAWQEI